MPNIEVGALVAGRYKLEARLDTGGRAEVWEAIDNELERGVAVKILRPSPGEDESTSLEEFRQEAQAEAMLKHPNIVEVYDWGHDGNLVYVVMELLEGQTVAEALNTQGPRPWPLVLSVGRQIASALAYAHQAGIAHGTVSADRIVVGPDGHATVIAFGLRCRGVCEVPPTPDSDTYALGGVLYEMLTGASPFAAAPAEHPEHLPWPRPVAQIAHDAPHELDRIVMKAIAPDPAERYLTAAELQADLDDLAAPKRRLWLWLALAVLAVAATALGTWYFSSQQKVVVPFVVGKSTSEASALFGQAGLKLVVSGRAASTSVATDTIVSESPAGGLRVRKGAQVGVVVSTGLPTVAVPSVIGATLETASSQIASAGLAVGAVTRQNSATIPADAVISSSPGAGGSVTVGTIVDLVVSAGQATVTMPDVRGATQANATAKLTNVGLKVDVGQSYSGQPVGSVVSQGPAGGATVPAGATVTISISKGPAPVTVPDLVDATRSNAQATLSEMGFVAVVSVEASGTDVSNRGKVVHQEPDPGTSVPPGSRVRLTIGN